MSRLYVLEEYFIPGDVHWNERGHELIVEGFLQFKDVEMAGDACCCQ